MAELLATTNPAAPSRRAGGSVAARGGAGTLVQSPPQALRGGMQQRGTRSAPTLHAARASQHTSGSAASILAATREPNLTSPTRAQGGTQGDSPHWQSSSPPSATAYSHAHASSLPDFSTGDGGQGAETVETPPRPAPDLRTAVDAKRPADLQRLLEQQRMARQSDSEAAAA